ncbi:MAG: hypothetical protein Q7R41_16185 [Phycisphaerales bacterium]|nr:hypothetical protein [Phycisphaerales bacterium]
MYTVLILAFTSLIAQTSGLNDKNSPVAEKMKALSFMVGEWEGEGWMQMGPQERKTVKVKESVRLKLSGMALLVEGRGTSKTSEGGEGTVVHEALAVISWDSKKEQYSMRAITAKAGAVDPKIEVGDKSMVWSFDTPVGGAVRYSIKVNEKGQWLEIGEFSRDGKEWNKFFEMTLSKMK